MEKQELNNRIVLKIQERTNIVDRIILYNEKLKEIDKELVSLYALYDEIIKQQ